MLDADPISQGLADDEEPWYQQLRRRWKPEHVRLLLIAESAPDPGAADADRRFFYAPTVSRSDNLFRGVVLALYDEKVKSGDDRAPLLTRLHDDGIWLIDLAPYPVNHLSATSRRKALLDHVPARVRDVLELAPDGIVICHAPTYRALAPSLHVANAPLLHHAPIPFPLGNHRRRFVTAVREAVSQLRLSA